MESQEKLSVSVAPTVINAKLKDSDQRFHCQSCDYVTCAVKLLTTHMQTNHLGQHPCSSWSKLETYVAFEDTSSNAKVELDPLQCCGDNRFDLASMGEQVTDCAFKNTDVKQEISEVPSNFQEAIMVGQKSVDGIEKTEICVKEEVFDYMEESLVENGNVEETESFENYKMFGDNQAIFKVERSTENTNVTTTHHKNNNNNKKFSGNILKSEEIDLGVDIKSDESRYGFQCRKCDFQSEHGNDFRNHFELHLIPENDGYQEERIFLENCQARVKNTLWTDPTKFPCEYCPYESKDHGNWKLHMITDHLSLKKPCPNLDAEKLRTFNCNMCSFTTNLVKKLVNHEFITHAPFIDSNGVTTSPIDIKESKSERKQKVGKWFKCEYCEFRYQRPFQLRKHNYSKHTPREAMQFYYCGHCTYRTLLEKTLQKHIFYKHTPEELITYHKCSECTYKTIRRYSLRTHVLAKHTSEDAIKWFECEECPYKAKLKACFQQHMRKHKGLELKCDHCSYKSLRNSQLQKHIAKNHKKTDTELDEQK